MYNKPLIHFITTFVSLVLNIADDFSPYFGPNAFNCISISFISVCGENNDFPPHTDSDAANLGNCFFDDTTSQPY